MEFNGSSFDEFKTKFREETGKEAKENFESFLSFIKAHQLIVIAERLSEISVQIKEINKKND